jgi:predicted SprT family Zn-dependent metalloprotease
MSEKKRGRKRIHEYYFGEREEEAVVRFITSNDEVERNDIYVEFLKDPLNKMIDSIIRRYKLYRKDETYENLHADTLSFLLTKTEKFEPEKGKKAYSYYGTICRNYLLGNIIKDENNLRKNLPYDDVAPSIEEREDMLYHLDIEPEDKISNLIGAMVKSVEDVIKYGDSDNDIPLTNEEKKVGEALVQILSNWETIYHNLEGGSKYNKQRFLSDVRELTRLSTKDIRVAFKRFKVLYYVIKTDRINNDLL